MLEGLSSPEQELALSDCALMMKQIGLWLLADEHRGGRPAPGFLMESPRDPMDYMPTEATKEDMPSFWNFEEVKKARELMGASLLTMDQGPMGHVKRKPTCLMVANLPQMKELDGVSGEGRGEVEATSLTGRLAQSRERSSWAPGLVAAVKECLKNFLLDYRRRWNAEEIVHHGEPGVKRMSMESWKTHVRNQHQPYRRDCRRCMELMGVDAPHRRTSGDRSAHCLSYDILGPMPLGDDVGLSTKAKYIMVATVAIPKLPRGLGGDGDHQVEKMMKTALTIEKMVNKIQPIKEAMEIPPIKKLANRFCLSLMKSKMRTGLRRRMQSLSMKTGESTLMIWLRLWEFKILHWWSPWSREVNMMSQRWPQGCTAASRRWA